MSAIQAVLAFTASGIALFLAILVRDLVADVRYAVAAANWPDGIHCEP